MGALPHSGGIVGGVTWCILYLGIGRFVCGADILCGEVQVSYCSIVVEQWSTEL